MLAPLQQQLSTFWQKQTNPQRITMLALGLSILILVPVLLVWANRPTYAVAYSALSEEDAATIVEQMDLAGVDYQLKNSGTILVPSDQVYEVRLQMAREGLPKSSAVGYELFNGNSLGMTEFTQKVNYQRALEGELERTISSLDAVETVRVHVVQPEKSLLSNDQALTTASITIQEKSGKTLTSSNVKAVANLVASSVEGLSPENVVVIDTEGRMLSTGTDSLENMTSQSDSHRAIELAAAAEIKRKVENMLSEVLGPDKAAVQASVVMSWNQKEITSNTFDPTPAAIRSSQIITENYTSDGTTVGGVPGAESNLPVPGELVGGGEGATSYEKKEETLNYEITQVQEKEVVAPGQIQKITLSVMLDGITDQSQLDAIESVVAAAAGIDEARGDMLVVAPMAFDRTFIEEQEAVNTQQEQMDLYLRIGMIVGAVLLLFLMIGFISRLIRNVRMASGEQWKPILKPVGEMALEGANGMGGGFSGFSQMEAAYNSAANHGPRVSQPPRMEDLPMPDEEVTLNLTPQKSRTRPEDDQRQKAISLLTEENPAAVAEIIQLWLSEDERNG
ncbi:MAG: flagellar M-ring protein FliF [Chloroflexi bacterium HGW-Chloroflexi-10]|nr:MAG: flagellar M-ring protein FliF [Chloroflexi bacterium HGW-Chloroflexi-10]